MRRTLKYISAVMMIAALLTVLTACKPESFFDDGLPIVDPYRFVMTM